MAQHDGKVIAVVGATGIQGGALSRRLLGPGWAVRALTRTPDGRRAEALAALGAGVVKSGSADPASLDRSFAGVHGVYSVQNHHISGHDGEVQQGKTSPMPSPAPASATSSTRRPVTAPAGPASDPGTPRWPSPTTPANSAFPSPSCDLRRSWS